MNLSVIKPALFKAGQALTKNAPHLLMGLGTGGSVAAVIFAAKATPKARLAVKEAKMESDHVLTGWETFKAAAPYYIPAGGMELFSLICFWGAHGIDMKRQAVLAGLCSTAEAALREYQKKVTEMIGEKGEREIRKSAAEDFIAANPPGNTIPLGDTDKWCLYDDQYFKSNYVRLKDIQNEANKEMIDSMYLSKAELKWLFDPDRKWLRKDFDDDMIGWNVNRLIELDINPVLDPNHETVLAIEVRDKDGNRYPPAPRFDMIL